MPTSTLTPAYPGDPGRRGSVLGMGSSIPRRPVDSDPRPATKLYWDRYGAAPEGLRRRPPPGERLWSTRFGHDHLGAHRRSRPGSNRSTEFEGRVSASAHARGRLSRRRSSGLRFRPVKDEGLACRARAPPTSPMLFVSASASSSSSPPRCWSACCSVSASNSDAQGRSGCCWPWAHRVSSSVRNGSCIAEGALLAAIWVRLVGLAGGVGFAGLMMAGLRTLWRPAVGSSRAVPARRASLSLAVGWIRTLVVGALSVDRLDRAPPEVRLPPPLLAGSVREPSRVARTRGAASCPCGSPGAGWALARWRIVRDRRWPQVPWTRRSLRGWPSARGRSILVSGLAFFSLWCRASRGRRHGQLTAGTAHSPAWPRATAPGTRGAASSRVALVADGLLRDRDGRREAAASSATICESVRTPGPGDSPWSPRPTSRCYQDLNRVRGVGLELGFDDEADSEAVARKSRCSRSAVCPATTRAASTSTVRRPPRARRARGADPSEAASRFQKYDARSCGRATDPVGRCCARSLEPGRRAGVRRLQLGDVDPAPRPGPRVVMRRRASARPRAPAARRPAPGPASSRASWSSAEERAPRALPQSPAAATASSSIDTGRGSTRARWRGAGGGRSATFGFDAVDDAQARIGGVQGRREHLPGDLPGARRDFGLLLGTIGLGIVLVRNVIERRGELATLRAFGFRRVPVWPGWSWRRTPSCSSSASGSARCRR